MTAHPHLATEMYEVRIHGRGGQGAVSAAELLSLSAFDAGRVAQAFPSFGSERSGAPVSSFCRIADGLIRAREPITTPDALIVLDATLLKAIDVFQGLKPTGVALINSALTPSDLGLDPRGDTAAAYSVVCVAATDIARRHLGQPLPSGVMLGAFSALTGVVPIAGIEQALIERFHGEVGRANAAGAREAFDIVSASQRQVTHA